MAEIPSVPVFPTSHFLEVPLALCQLHSPELQVCSWFLMQMLEWRVILSVLCTAEMLEIRGGHPTIELFQPCIPLNDIQTMKESKAEVDPCS